MIIHTRRNHNDLQLTYLLTFLISHADVSKLSSEIFLTGTQFPQKFVPPFTLSIEGQKTPDVVWGCVNVERLPVANSILLFAAGSIQRVKHESLITPDSANVHSLLVCRWCSRK